MEGAQGVEIRWLINKDDGAENFAMRMFEIETEGYTPCHSHPWEHEIFILEGHGKVIGTEGEHQLKGGYVIFIPPDEKHQIRNNGDQILKLLCHQNQIILLFGIH